MTWEEARKIVYSRFLTAWSPAYAAYTPFFPGQSEPDLTVRTTPFVLFRVAPAQVRMASVGQPMLHRKFGKLHACIFVPDSSGDKTITGPLELLASLFVGTGEQGVVFLDAFIPESVTAAGWRSQDFVSTLYFDQFN